MKLAHGTILLVVDGSQMMVLRNQGDTVAPDLVVVKHNAIETPKNSDIQADAPGVGFPRMGQGRDTYDKADPRRLNEDHFVAQAASALARLAKTHKGDLIVVAPPPALGVLRRHYDPSVKQRMIAEIPKDFSNHPVQEIARLIMAY